MCIRDRLKEGLAEIEEGMNEIMQAGQFLSDTFSKLGDSFGGVFGGIAEGFSVAMDTVCLLYTSRCV